MTTLDRQDPATFVLADQADQQESRRRDVLSLVAVGVVVAAAAAVSYTGAVELGVVAFAAAAALLLAERHPVPVVAAAIAVVVITPSYWGPVVPGGSLVLAPGLVVPLFLLVAFSPNLRARSVDRIDALVVLYGLSVLASSLIVFGPSVTTTVDAAIGSPLVAYAAFRSVGAKESWRRVAVWTLVIALGVTAAVTLVEAATQFNVFRTIGGAGLADPERTGLLTRFGRVRAEGPFGQPVPASLAFAAGLVAAVGNGIMRRWTALTAGLAVVALGGILVTSSRTGAAAAAFGLLLLAIKGTASGRVRAVLAAGMLLAAGLLLTGASEQVETLVGSVSGPANEAATVEHRTELASVFFDREYFTWFGPERLPHEQLASEVSRRRAPIHDPASGWVVSYLVRGAIPTAIFAALVITAAWLSLRPQRRVLDATIAPVAATIGFGLFGVTLTSHLAPIFWMSLALVPRGAVPHRRRARRMPRRLPRPESDVDGVRPAEDADAQEVLHVGYVVHRYPQLTQTFVRNEIAALRRRGVLVETASVVTGDNIGDGSEVAVISQLAGSYPATARAIGLVLRHPGRAVRFAIATRRLPGEYGRGGTRVRHRGLLALAATWERAGVSAVHAHFGWSGAAAAMGLARLLDIPWSLTVHANDMYAGEQNLRAKLADADRVVTVCQYNRQILADEWGVTADIPVVICGVEDQKRSDREPDLDIVAVGRLVEKKGFDVLLDAVAALVDRPRSVVIVGDGPLRDQLGSKVAEHGLGDVVTFAGAASHEATLEYIDRARVLVAPFRIARDGDRDSMPVVVKEAMIRAKPVIGSDVAGMPEMLSHGCGVLVPSDSVDELAGAIEELRADPARQRELGARARDRARAAFLIDDAARAMELVLRGMVGTHRSAARGGPG